MRRRTSPIFAALAALLLFPAAALAQTSPGIDEISRLDLLPSLKRSIKVASISSYDRTGENDDGFSGKYSFVRKEPGGLVIADLEGPGVIYRIWTPTPTDDMVEFYFDGETTPRIKVRFRDIFTGTEFPFLSPVAAVGGGGFTSYVPLPYKESCKIVVKGERVMFYQINYATYPAGMVTASYEPSEAFKAGLERARALFGAAGTDVSAHGAPDKTRLEIRGFQTRLPPGKTAVIAEIASAGRIAGLRLGPASAFASKDRDILIRFTWDGEKTPAISVPVGDLFGYSWGQPAVKSLLVGTANDTNYIYLPMPFDRSARIELVSERRSGPDIDIRGEVVISTAGRTKDEGKLYAVWHRENPTVEGRPFTFVDVKGRGHVVGFILQAQGTAPGKAPEFFEGDDQTTIDGELTVHGTGSEDFFNGGWYDVPGRWESRVSFPLSGCLDFKRPLARTGGYRFLIGDAYAYTKSVRSTIEHGPSGNRIPSDYTAVTFFYSENTPELPTLPTVADRRVHDLDQTVFTPGFNTPIHAFSWNNAELSKTGEKFGDEDVRFLSLRTREQDFFGDHYVSFICEMPAAGRYRVSIEAIAGPAQGIVRLFRNEVGVGTAADLYAPARAKSGPIQMGVLDLDEGDNHMMFKLVGKNAKATGAGLDLYRIICERVE